VVLASKTDLGQRKVLACAGGSDRCCGARGRVRAAGGRSPCLRVSWSRSCSYPQPPGLSRSRTHRLRGCAAARRRAWSPIRGLHGRGALRRLPLPLPLRSKRRSSRPSKRLLSARPSRGRRGPHDPPRDMSRRSGFDRRAGRSLSRRNLPGGRRARTRPSRSSHPTPTRPGARTCSPGSLSRCSRSAQGPF
jgi:hypothetical protein